MELPEYPNCERPVRTGPGPKDFRKCGQPAIAIAAIETLDIASNPAGEIHVFICEQCFEMTRTSARCLEIHHLPQRT